MPVLPIIVVGVCQAVTDDSILVGDEGAGDDGLVLLEVVLVAGVDLTSWTKADLDACRRCSTFRRASPRHHTRHQRPHCPCMAEAQYQASTSSGPVPRNTQINQIITLWTPPIQASSRCDQ